VHLAVEANDQPVPHQRAGLLAELTTTGAVELKPDAGGLLAQLREDDARREADPEGVGRHLFPHPIQGEVGAGVREGGLKLFARSTKRTSGVGSLRDDLRGPDCITPLRGDGNVLRAKLELTCLGEERLDPRDVGALGHPQGQGMIVFAELRAELEVSQAAIDHRA